MPFSAEKFWNLFGTRISDPFEGFSYSVIMQYYGCVSVKDIITKSLDVLTIVVPPALPVKVQKRQFQTENCQISPLEK